MLARNALAVLAATALTATLATAQQPAKPAPSTRSTAVTHAQQPAAAAKKSPRTSAAAALAVSADSAKKVVLANVPSAKVSSERLHRSNGKAYYMFSYRAKGQTKQMHASVDATTGAFSMTVPAGGSTRKAPAPKKPS